MHKNLTDILKDNEYLKNGVLKGMFGIEKENLRVTKDGHLSLNKHPEILGDKGKHPYITTDFSESQIEMITPPCESVDSAHDFISNLHDTVVVNIGDELLWPQSMPPIIPSSSDDIPIAKYSDTKEGLASYNYRLKLAKKYGRRKQLLSGVHFNFSFDDRFLEKLREVAYPDLTPKDFKNKVYMKTSRNLLRYNWLLIYLFGSSVGAHSSYSKKCNSYMTKNLVDDSYYFENSTSLRNSTCGYRNLKPYFVSFKDVDSYIGSIKELIKSEELSELKEFYNSVRIKSISSKPQIDALVEDGISYLELRFLDLNPLDRIGIDKDSLKFIHLLSVLSLFDEDNNEYTPNTKLMDDSNSDIVASLGRKEGIFLLKDNERISLTTWKDEIFKKMKDLLGILGNPKDYTESFEKVLSRWDLGSGSKEILDGIKEKGFIDFHLGKAKTSLALTREFDYKLLGYEHLELSTQLLIRDAMLMGLKFDVLDPVENFLSVERDGKKEYIKQASKTSLDSYTTVLAMENKLITKKILSESGVRVPVGSSYTSIEDALFDYELYKDGGVVIKPNNTNYGIGISIFKNKVSKETFEEALKISFSYDKTVLVEEFLKGEEYRFLVIGDKTIAVLNRRAANVVGDGKLSIRELVEIKNSDPRRGTNHNKPLEKIVFGDIEMLFLKEQGLTPEYVPSKDERVFLRENSNISTGGDSIDVTDYVHDGYKKLAVEAAKSVEARVCGVDIIIPDYTVFDLKSCGIIELNFNPALNMHAFPYKGTPRRGTTYILKELGF